MSWLITKFRRLKQKISQIDELVRKVDDLQKAVGRVEARQILPDLTDRRSLRDYEFKVYSQWGEDGIIQFLIHSIEIERKIFVEFGVQDYKESNTRFLLQHDHWSGLVIDSSEEDIRKIKQDPIYFWNNLLAARAFIDRENINSLVVEHGINGDIGLLSIDIDGNDYWIWEAITRISPRIVICEYDSRLGHERAVTTPYDKTFDRRSAHYSFLYGGASIAALHRLGRKKGYSLVGSNSAGVNLFFVRDDLLSGLKPLTPREAYVKAQFRNSLDKNGNPTYLSFEDSVNLVADMPLYDLENGTTIKVRDLTKNSVH